MGMGGNESRDCAAPRPRICLVAAMAENRVIGRDHALPWHLPADLRHFRRLTLGKPVIMGRSTHEAIGRPLPERFNIVLSRDPAYSSPGCTVVQDPEGALAAAGPAPEVMVIGGAYVYRAFLPRADRIYLTLVHGRFAGDTWFPPLESGVWAERDREDHPPDEANPYPYSFITLER
jgi:dihydrofolate reductase